MKQCIEGIGSSKTKHSIIRTGKAIGTIDNILQKFDEENNLTAHLGAHKAATYTNDHLKVVENFKRHKVFQVLNRTPYKSHPRPPNLLSKLSKNDLLSWMMTVIPYYSRTSLNNRPLKSCQTSYNGHTEWNGSILPCFSLRFTSEKRWLSITNNGQGYSYHQAHCHVYLPL